MAAHCHHDPIMARCSLPLREIFFALVDTRRHGVTARCPDSWAHFPMFVSELESPNQSQTLTHIVANRRVVYGDLVGDTSIINDKEALE